ncbi:MAG: adenylosuccinate lyase [Fervidicoccaceae archaeon]
MSDLVCPFDFRYGSDEMRSIFSRSATLRRLAVVEAAIVGGLEDAGLAPRGCYERILECSSSVAPEEVDAEERRTGHDVAAFASLLGERCGECGKYVHLGATSYDVVDTAWALALRDALAVLKRRMLSLVARLSRLAKEHSGTIMVGRTHGRHALPITLGFKLANYAYELARSYERLCECEKRLTRGKIAGAVGTMAGWMGRGLEVERGALARLGLEPHAISTQIAPRDGFAELVCSLALIASQLDRLALELRELARDEIGEVRLAARRIGSSAMPHKRNPILAERVSGLARLSRGLCASALENVVLMHERDLTNSSLERILVPHALLVVDQMLIDMGAFLDEVEFDEEAMRRNLELSGGALASECLVVKLVTMAGLSRREAYSRVMELISLCSERRETVRDALSRGALDDLLERGEALECLNYSKYLGNARELTERALEYVEEAVRRC